MKHVFNQSEVPHIWAAQSQHDGRNAGGNLFFEGATIFSYGKHFPIATIEGSDVLLTLRKYSNTTSKHVYEVQGAVSNHNIIECYDVPVKYDDNKPLKKQSFTRDHEHNLNTWKSEIKTLFDELANKRNRDTQGRMLFINRHITRLERYCQYFNLKIKDKELKKFLAIAASSDFIEKARGLNEKQIADREKKMKKSALAYDAYLKLWRDHDTEAITNLSEDIKTGARFYQRQTEAFTRLRFNPEQKRIETSKGVLIPVEIAKRAYKTLNGCMEGICASLNIPVLDYTITQTTDKAIIAGCHTIPKEDVIYIAQLLKW